MSGKLNSIQTLRAIACLAVVAHHAFRATTLFLHPPENSVFVPQNYIVQFGAAGVDIFFVISGFLMTYISEPYFSGQRTPTNFITNRIIRIWPPYAIVTLAQCAIILFTQRNQPGIPFDLSPLRLTSLLFIPSFNQKGVLQPIIGPGWTLNYEMMFYLCFTLVLFLGRYLAFVKLALIICLLFVAGKTVSNGVIREFLGSPIIFEFLIGAAIGFSQAKGRFAIRLPFAWVLLSAGLLAVLYRYGFRAEERLIAYGAPAATLFIGFLGLDNKKLRWPPLITMLGDASYSIYLVHIPLIHPVTGFCSSYLNRHGFCEISTIIASISAIAIAVLVGIVFYWTVERPVVKRCQIAYNSRKQKAQQVVPPQLSPALLQQEGE